ncbi:MAG: FlgD immunoglobulin-like domain containing protein [bacterium]
MFRLLLLLSSLAFWFLLLIVCPVSARTWRVPADASTIQAGVDSSAAGDTVLVAPGAYNESEIVLKSGIVLRGETGVPRSTSINGQQSGSVLLCINVDSTCCIEALTISGGYALNGGGGIFCFYAHPTITNCLFIENIALAHDGGGIACLHSSPLVTDCQFLANRANWGGGGVSCNQSQARFVNCTFNGNQANTGAGIGFSGRSDIEVIGCTFVGNIGSAGGGLASYSSFCHVTGCTFSENDAHKGAGIYTSGSNIAVFNTLIAYNEGLAFKCSPEGLASDIQISCSDLYGNTGGDWTECIESFQALNANLSVPPGFCNPAAKDFTLSAESPCLPENNDCAVLIGAHGAGCSMASAASDIFPSLSIDGIHPNPSNPLTTVHFSLQTGQQTHIAIYEPSGRRLVVLADRHFSAGSHVVVWDGKDAAGRAVASGIYFVKVTGARAWRAEKLVLVR